MEVKKVVCPNCGAAIYENDEKCPFCGYINISGAEEKFMRDIKKTERDMSHIPDMQKEEYKKSMSKGSKIIFATVAVTLVLAVIAFLIYMLFDKFAYSYTEADAKAQMIWNRENYPILDEMYEAGDYDGIIEFENKLFEKNADDKTEYRMYEWEHYDFISGYRNYLMVENYFDLLDLGEELSRYGKENLVYYCMWFYYRQYDQSHTYMVLTDEEIEILDGYREITNGYLFGRMGFTQEEVEELLKDAVDEYNYLNARECYEYGKKIGDRFK